MYIRRSAVNEDRRVPSRQAVGWLLFMNDAAVAACWRRSGLAKMKYYVQEMKDKSVCSMYIL